MTVTGLKSGYLDGSRAFLLTTGKKVRFSGACVRPTGFRDACAGAEIRGQRSLPGQSGFGLAISEKGTLRSSVRFGRMPVEPRSAHAH